eukprot:CAMPEP_0171285736 /NCGR_PEP_ID=MMETSP0790-20130122/68626_1 /TAXON_ID=2925 /ORGANISM="Alexandrium catenella, Strain OF101" /LENGTH=35 /DNA_ID= /DNA_START= /DNA_END= /DNA_ORIENTATION=
MRLSDERLQDDTPATSAGRDKASERPGAFVFSDCA